MNTASSDFFNSQLGSSAALDSRRPIVWRTLDVAHDIALHTSTRLSALRNKAKKIEPRRILIVGIEVPSRAADIHNVVAALRQGSRHALSTSIVVMGNAGKFENIDRAIAGAAPLSEFDWLIVTDDDIDFAAGFLDDLITLAEASGLSLLQPAHAFFSHASYAITRRRWGSLVRQTRFVEIGPLTLIKANVFNMLVPFPPSRWCYGIDLVWSELLSAAGFGLGIVDGAPIRHVRPVAASYDMGSAIEEGKGLLQRFGVRASREQLLGTDRIIIATH